MSFLGIILAALLAPPLGRLSKPLLVAVGLKNPLLAWVLGPLIVFVIISALVKVGALMLHQKVDVYYKYKAGDLRLALWERLNHRVGLCVGLLNGVAYLILISFVIYAFSYWTVQMATSEEDPKLVKILNRLGQDLEKSGFAKVGRAIDGLPQSFYDAADIAGVIYNNPLAEGRLSRYPGLLPIAERPEFQDLANDAGFSSLRQQRRPIREVMDYPKANTIINNPDLMKSIWETLKPDLKDLETYLTTFHSAKYDPEGILGRWNFDVNSAIAAYRRSKPNMPSGEMQRMKTWMTTQFAKTSLVAMPGGQAIFKNEPRFAPGGPPSVVAPLDQGQWTKSDGKYQFTFSSGGQMPATVAGDRLKMTNQGTELVLNRED